MGTKWATTAVSGYASASVTDDGAATAANQVKYNTIKTDLTNPIKSTLVQVIANLDELFTIATKAKSGSYTTVASDHTVCIEVTGTNTITLLSAVTAGAGYRVTVKNAGTGIVTVARSAAETIDGATSHTLLPKESATYCVNAAVTNYVVLSSDSLLRGSNFYVNSSTTPVVTGLSGSSTYNSMKAFGNSTEIYDNAGKVSGWVLTPAAGGTSQVWRIRVYYVLTHDTAFTDGALIQVCITRFNSSDVAQSRYVVSQHEMGVAVSSVYGSGEITIGISVDTDYITVESSLNTATNYNMFQLEFTGERVL